MTASDIELAAMRRAITISAQGIGTTSPNPPVGCVVLDKYGTPVGEGWHQRKGEAHAEVNALRAAGERAREGTAVVTLEPCNHHGRTPPCRQALLDAGIARVVVALGDPTSRGEGGIAVLRGAGVSVEVGLLKEEALLVLGQWRRSLDGGPQVTWIYALSSTGQRMPLPPGSTAAVDASALCRLVDVVLQEDLTVAQGRPGELDWELRDRRIKEFDTGSKLIARLADTGARTVVVIGSNPLVEDLRNNGEIRQIRAYVPASASSAPGQRSLVTQAVPEHFQLIDVLPLSGWTRLTMNASNDHRRAPS